MNSSAASRSATAISARMGPKTSSRARSDSWSETSTRVGPSTAPASPPPMRPSSSTRHSPPRRPRSRPRRAPAPRGSPSGRRRWRDRRRGRRAGPRRPPEGRAHLLLPNLVAHDDADRAGEAALAGGAEGRAHDRGSRLVQIGVGHHHERVLGAAQRLHTLAGLGRAGCDQPRGAGLADERDGAPIPGCSSRLSTASRPPWTRLTTPGGKISRSAISSQIRTDGRGSRSRA